MGSVLSSHFHNGMDLTVLSPIDVVSSKSHVMASKFSHFNSDAEISSIELSGFYLILSPVHQVKSVSNYYKKYVVF